MEVRRAPLGQHAASPAELREQLHANRRGDAYLLFRDGDGAQQLVTLAATTDRATIGRGSACDVRLAWDDQVSRVHAQLERVAGDWTVFDDGLSRNGTFVDGERLRGRRRLLDGDALVIGATEIAFRAPDRPTPRTAVPRGAPPIELSPAQRRVLVALCRPFAPGAGGSRFPRPASNADIAAELVLSVAAVKTHLRTLFARLSIEKDLVHNEKRARLVERAFELGLVSMRELEER